MYKVRDTATGLFSTGGVMPSWRKVGKVWTSRAALKSHLTNYQNFRQWESHNGVMVSLEHREVPATWEIVPCIELLGEAFPARVEAARPAKK